jgi:GT2 family glycosyltransferase
VSIIILNYNGRDALESCLDSVFASFYSPFEVIVVDNGSTDGSAETARRKWGFKLIKKRSNTGYSGGNNTGIQAAHGEFLVLLNNDTIVDPSWLTELVGEALRSKADFCQPKIVIPGRSRIINSAGSTIHLAGFGLMIGGGEVDKGQYDEWKEIYGLHGACIFVSRKAIEKVGLLDVNFFAFNEDTDWAWRALLMGLKLVYVPKALVYHIYGKTWGLRTTKKIYYAERNRIIMLLTNYSRRSYTLLLPLFVVTEIATVAYLFFTGMLTAKILGYADLLRMRNYIAKRRRWIQKRRRRSDREIVTMFAFRFKHPFLAKCGRPLNMLYTFLCKLIIPFI